MIYACSPHPLHCFDSVTDFVTVKAENLASHN